MEFIPRSKIKPIERDRFLQAYLLLTRLNDDDIACPMASRHLNIESDYVLESCVNFFQAYCYIIVKAKVLVEAGYELSEHWEEALVSAFEHFDYYCVSCLTKDDLSQYTECSMLCFSTALAFHRRSLAWEVYNEKQRNESSC